MDASLVTPGDCRYPARLSSLEGAPPLWISGRYRPARRAVAVVGARATTIRALELAREIGRALARAGVDVISGGALGVDGAAHRGALDVGGVTVAVLGTGIDVVYPERHAGLFEEIVASRGALVTQFPPGQPPRRRAFPERNQVIAALADAVVVVDAQLGSGSLHTARFAELLGRKLIAVPGSPGADALLVQGARAARTANDVLAIVEGREPALPALPERPEAVKLYKAMDDVPRDVGDLAFRAGLALSTCAAMVIDLELGGLAARAAGGRYLRLR